MSLGDGQFENAYAKERLDRLLANADAVRAARDARRTSLFRRLRQRLRQRLRPGRQTPLDGTFGEPGH